MSASLSPAKRRRRRLLPWIVAAVALLAVLGGAYGYMKHRSAGVDAVKTFTVTRKSIAHTLQIAGKVTPDKSTVITAHQSGRIIEVAVKEGAQVKEGDLLFTMLLEAEGQTDLLQKRAEVRSLEHDVAAAEAQFKDKKSVRDLIGTAQVAKDEADLEKLRLDLNAARDRLAVLEEDLGLTNKSDDEVVAGVKPVKAAKAIKARTTAAAGKDARYATETTKNGVVYVTSPSRGIVTLIDKRPGDFVVGGAAATTSTDDRQVMVVADMSTLQVKTRVLEADLRYVKPDIPVTVKLDAYPDVLYEGHVEHIGGQGRTDSKAGYTYFDVYVAVAQQDARLLPEMNATVELIFAKRDNVLTIPVAGVVIFPNKVVVHRPDEASDHGFKEQEIKIGVVNESDVEITSGLNEGDKVQEIDFAALKLDDENDSKTGHPKPKPKSS